MTSCPRLLKRMDANLCQKKRKGKFSRKKLIHEKALQSESWKKQSCNELLGDRSFFASTKYNEDDNGVYEIKQLKRVRRHKRKKDKVVLDEPSKLQRRARYLLVKMKLEQNLIDAYSGEGWKGQSREKIRPEKELQRAKKQILVCKLGIRDVVHQLDILSSVGQIEESLIAPDGSVHHDHIHCAKCKSQEASEDNDIILCDGTCNCAFHQKCLDPPLATENIPPEDQGWLCKYCECKLEILEAMNAHLGTQFSANDGWKDIFKEEASSPNGGNLVLNLEDEWPGDDSEDNDYDPESDGKNGCWSDTEANASDRSSHLSSSYCSLESEAYLQSNVGGSAEKNKTFNNNSLMESIVGHDSDGHPDHEIVSGPRRRYDVDYEKLYDEMFGKDTAITEQLSEDEDWGPPKKQRREKECDAASTLMTLCDSEKRHSDQQIVQPGRKPLPSSRPSKSFSRIPVDAVEKLRQLFAENELPSRAVKQKISEQLDLEYEKVSKWFKNARYVALKTRKAEEPHYSAKNSYKSSTETKRHKMAKSVKCHSIVTSIHKVKPLQRVSWRTNLMSILSPLKQRQQRDRASLGSLAHSTKGGMELSDDMSLKKHLLHLKAKIREKKSLGSGMRCGGQEAEVQMEQVCQIEAKLRNLKQILLKLQPARTDQPDEPNVVYIPIAELKEKVCR